MEFISSVNLVISSKIYYFASSVSETGLHLHFRVLVHPFVHLELILNLSPDVDLKIQQSVRLAFSSPEKPSSRFGTRTCSLLAFCFHFRRTPPNAAAWLYARSYSCLHRSHHAARRGRNHGHIQHCCLPSLDLCQVWQSCVQQIELRLTSNRFHRRRLDSKLAVGRSRVHTHSTTAPQEQRPTNQNS